jgi:hypothetical protein
MSESKSRFRPAGSRAGDGEIETSGTEKVLAVVLAVFIAIGAVWGYGKLDEIAKSDSTSYVPAQKLIGAEEFSAIQTDRQAIVRCKELGEGNGLRPAGWSSAARRTEPHWTPMNQLVN